MATRVCPLSWFRSNFFHGNPRIASSPLKSTIKEGIVYRQIHIPIKEKIGLGNEIQVICRLLIAMYIFQPNLSMVGYRKYLMPSLIVSVRPNHDSHNFKGERINLR
jgi:hypothetical protein